MTKPGMILDGKYEILKKIGQGGMSVVYLARDNRLNKQWAVKEIKNDGTKDTDILMKSLEREANILKNADHPVLPRIVDIKNENGTIYVIMDFVEGKTLSDVLKEEGPQKQSDVIKWGRALASALDYLHSMSPPVIYRDMKPSNVMLKPDGRVKLIDFGAAKEYVVGNNADTTALGTRGYAAPEQFGDSKGHGIYNTDARTDIYNLGATLYHLVTGKNPCDPPYEIKPIRQWNPMLSSGLEQIIIKCCQTNPEDRYQSCSELLYALDHYNELDNEYRAKSRKKLIIFSVTAGLSLLSAACAVIGSIKKKELKEKNYNNKIVEAEEARQNNDIDSAISIYKEAVALDETVSDAYLGLLDTYAYYYENDSDFLSEAVESSAEMGVRYVTKYMDSVRDDVIYEVAIIYYDEIQDYKTAMKYFNEVDDSENFPDEAAQALYYSAICENKVNKSTSFSNSKDNIFGFEEYNGSELEDTNISKYANYLNIASIYVDNLESDVDDMPQRIIDLLTEANEKLDENSMVLANAFPENRGIKYYTGQYARILYSVYTYQAEKVEDNAEKEEYYLKAADSLNRYLASMDITAEGISESIKKSYVKYMVEEAETYVSLALVSGNDNYYEMAETIYSTAETAIGYENSAADIYVSHLDYLYDRYSEEYGSNPENWKQEGINKVKAVYSEGSNLDILYSRGNNEWNSLIVNSVISYILENGGTVTENSEEVITDV